MQLYELFKSGKIIVYSDIMKLKVRDQGLQSKNLRTACCLRTEQTLHTNMKSYLYIIRDKKSLRKRIA